MRCTSAATGVASSRSRDSGRRGARTNRRADRRRRSGGLVQEGAQLGIGRGLRLDVGEERVHLPAHAVGVLEPELVGLRVAARRVLLAEDLEALVLLPDALA